MDIARRLVPRRGQPGGRRRVDQQRLAVNFSFVLHEASTSATVRSAVRSASGRAPGARSPQDTIIDGDIGAVFGTVLVPAIGNPGEIARLLGHTTTLVRIDSGDEPLCDVTFFRAPARLTLPADDLPSVSVAALVSRPGGRSRQLLLRGPFDWQRSRDEALRSLEALIQAHLDQWCPEAQLWEGPAETLLPDEVR